MFDLDAATSLNAWWSVNPWSQVDPDLLAAKAAAFGWDQQPFTADDLTSGGVYSLRGPSGVGKTTVAKALIADRSAAGLGRRTCLLTPALVSTTDDLTEAIEVVLRLWPNEEGRWLFILDDLTTLRGWAATVASLREYNGRFRLSTVIAIGSSVIDLAESEAALALWRGKLDRPDRLMLPASFRDYMGARTPDTGLPDALSLDEILSPAGRLRAKALMPRANELDQYLMEYARAGGLPQRLSEQLSEGSAGDVSTAEMWARLGADIHRLGRREAIASKVIGATVSGLGSMTRWGNLKKSLGLAKTTVSSYMDLMSDSFALLVLHQKDPRKPGQASLTKPRKVYFGDTGLAAIPAGTGDGPVPTDAALVENLLALALYRAGEPAPMTHFSSPQMLYTWKSVNGRELDFLLDGPTPLPVDSWYGAKPGGKAYEALTKSFGRGLVVSRLTLEAERPILTIPAGVLLAMLDTRPRSA